MLRNGIFFIAIVERKDVKPSVWDPYSYRVNDFEDTLGAFVTIDRLAHTQDYTSPFRPIEYRSIPKGNYLTFSLKFNHEHPSMRFPMVGEQKLLLGTMRAYLGNIIVTPKAGWLGLESPLLFPVKSEFICINPHDECVYFWWAYLRTQEFLRKLPLGSGGTRPRLKEEGLLKTPTKVPKIEIRQEINQELEESARREWEECIERARIISSLVSSKENNGSNT